MSRKLLFILTPFDYPVVNRSVMYLEVILYTEGYKFLLSRELESKFVLEFKVINGDCYK